jgi:Kef-type K+ transport system membrane component KefB/mannitol/fructose-specific phosphotransferase system IIA component (Ntr-type)
LKPILTFLRRLRLTRDFLVLGIFSALMFLPTVACASDGVGHDSPSMTHRMMMLAMQLGVIVLAARFGNILFTRLKLPGVVGELMTGVIIGPFVLGGIAIPGFPQGLFHVPESIAVGSIPVSPELYGICAIASIVLLFLVGLETDIGLFMRYSLAGSVVGIGGVIVTFLLGDFMAMLFSPMLFDEQLGFLDAPCLFLGIISTATSVGITARILSEKRKLDSPEGVTILAGAVIDDVLGMILLAIGMGIISASQGSGEIDWGHIGLIAFKAISVWLAATALGLLAARKISGLLKGFGDRSVIAVMALGLAMILAGLFEEAGLAMIIGAYVMGLTLSRTDLNHVIREKLHPVYVFLVPVFFTVMGMLVDVRLLASKEVLLFGLLYTFVAALAKMVGCGVPALFVNFNMRGALRIGAGMLPRGEVTLIIAGTGLAAGLLNPKIFGVVVFMTFCAALLAPPTLVQMFKSPKSGLRKPVKEDESSELAFSFPSFMAAELLVGKLLSAFESEGFFVHTLSREERLYQLRKEEVVIAFQHRDTDIVFDIKREQAPFVNTAMVEVVAELERTIRELRKPVDLAALSRRVQGGDATGPMNASLRGYLQRELLVADLKGESKTAVIDELLGVLVRQGLVRNEEEARQAVLAREESMSTGMQFGVAIPHGRTDAVDRLVCAIGIKHDGIDFDAIDGKPSRIFVLALSPVSAAAPHMQFMSMVSQVLNEQGRQGLLACDNENEMFAVLSGEATLPKRSSVMEMVKLRKDRKPALCDFLRRDLLIPDLTGETKDSIIEELLSALDATGAIADLSVAREAIEAREAQMSTGMERGVAIPHARTDTVADLICVVGVKPSGIDFGSLDGEPSQIFVLTLTPKSADAPHVQFMAMVSRALNPVGRDKVLQAKTPDDLWNALTCA